MRAAEGAVRARFADAAQLLLDPHIAAWKDVYRTFGANPNKFRPSAEALLRRVVRGDQLPAINKAVDAYNLIELHTLLPAGGYDLSAIRGDIHLRRSPGGEAFSGIGAAEAEKTDPGEVVYADDERILTRRWNYRDCHEARIVESSADIALFVEAPVASITTDEVRQMADRIAERVRRACGGTTRVGLLDVKQARSIDL